MFSALVSLFVACMAPVEIQVGVPGEAPAIVVSPAVLEFSAIGPGETAVQSVTVTSAGNDRLVLKAPELSAGSFALLAPLEDRMLEPGESWTFDVLWSAGDENLQVATLLLESDDPRRPTVLVPITGELGEGELVFDRNHDFGVLEVGCVGTTDLTLENSGLVEVSIEDVWSDGAAYGLLDAPELPLTLRPGEQLVLGVVFEPDFEGDTIGSLEVRSDLGRSSASLLGTGLAPLSDATTLEAGQPVPVDLIFALDASGSMYDDLAAMAQAFPHFVDGLESAGLNWRMGVVDQLSGCSSLDVLDSAEEGAVRDFSEALFAGTAASEQVLKLATGALEQTGVGECNGHLIRTDSAVHLVTASDEPDQGPDSWDVYVERMQASLGGAERLRISSFVGASDDGYRQAVAATSGALLDLNAADLAESMFLLAEASARCQGSREIAVPEGFDPDAVEVLRDGVSDTAFTVDVVRGVVVLETPVQCDEQVVVWTQALPTCG